MNRSRTVFSERWANSQRGLDAHLGEVVRRRRADPPDLLRGQRLQIGGDGPPRDDGEAHGFPVFGGDLGEDFGDAEACGDGDSHLPRDLRLDPQGDRFIGGSERSPHPGQVGEGLVDGILLHLGGEAADDVEHPPGEEAVGLVVGGEDDQPRTDPLRLVEGNPALDPQLFGRVARAGDDPPLAPRDERFPLQLRVDGLFAGGEEGVPVDVEDRPRPVVEAENGLIHGAACSE